MIWYFEVRAIFFRVQNPFGERLFQLVGKHVFGKKLPSDFVRKEARLMCPSYGMAPSFRRRRLAGD
jgi:hypothetical protein